jgi:hypothetical protein
MDRGRTVSPASIALGALAVASVAAAFVVFERRLQLPQDLSARWWKQGVAAVMASSFGLLLTNL